jgi:hypothetical protein
LSVKHAQPRRNAERQRVIRALRLSSPRLLIFEFATNCIGVLRDTPPKVVLKSKIHGDGADLPAGPAAAPWS